MGTRLRGGPLLITLAPQAMGFAARTRRQLENGAMGPTFT